MIPGRTRAIHSYHISILLLLSLFIMPGCDTGFFGGHGNDKENGLSEETLLNDTFRIDIKEIAVNYHIYPQSREIDAEARIIFRMRPGQTKAIIHFDPAENPDAGEMKISLNGESLDLNNPQDISILSFPRCDQNALEFNRILDGTKTHRLSATFKLDQQIKNLVFSTNVNDVVGRGNEILFPTLNTPWDSARHTITFRVHGDREYRCIGSGLVTRNPDPSIQEGRLDTEEEIPSYLIMFMLRPADTVIMEEREIAGVKVRIMTLKTTPFIQAAFKNLESWLPEFIHNIGPFPMKRGLSIFLARNGGGMEYFGAAMSSLRVLKHELFHMYFGCSTMAKTYRDSWFDEAVNKWYENSASVPDFKPISEGFRSDMVSARTPISTGFDTRAYNEGARIIEAVARELGGRQQMIAFLAHLHRNHSFRPFNTFDLLAYLKEYSGIDMTDHFLNWLYFGQRTYYSTTPGINHVPGKKVTVPSAAQSQPTR